MGWLSDLINETKAPEDKADWVNDYPNGLIFLVIMALGLFLVAFVAPKLGIF